VAAFLHASHEVLTQPVFLEEARSVLPEQAELLVMAGALHELLATPMPDAAGMPRALRQLAPGDHLRQAETFFRQALRQAPGLVEARIRLARVLGELGRHAEGRKELERVEVVRGDLRLAYLACLFRGQQEEALGDAAAASTAYRGALTIVPGARSALLALSHLARSGGHRAIAVEYLQRALEPPPARARRDDPWRDYFTAALGQRAGPLLAELRAHVSKGEGQ
jgi:tetratricopeptide (TPR) repeat protein